MAGFDVDGARKAGYSDDEILSHLGQSSNFDTDGAIKAGYSKQEVIDHLAATAPPPNPIASGLTPRPLKDTGTPVFPGETTGSIPTDFLAGGAASLAQIPIGGYNLIRRAIPALPAPPPYLQSFTVPPNTLSGHAGELATDVGTFMLPGGLEEKALGKLGSAGRLTRAAARAGVEGATTGGIEAVKSGGDPTKTLTAAALAGGTGGLVEGAGKPILNAVTDLWGKATGAGGEAIRTAYQQAASKGFYDAMRYRKSEDEIVGDLNNAVQDVMTKRAGDYRAAMGQLDQTIRLNPQPIGRDLTDQMAAYKIDIKAGKGKAFTNSPIVNPTDQSTMLQAIGDVYRWNDYSPTGLDTLKQRLTGYAKSVSPQAEPFFFRMADSVKQQLNANVPGYQALTAGYSKASDLLQMTRKELSANAANPGTTMRKLTYIFNQNNDFRRILLESLDDAAGSDMKNTMAGYGLRTWMARGLAGVSEGVLAPFLDKPKLLRTVAFGSPRLAGESMALLSALRRSRIPSVSASAVLPAISNQILPTELTPPPANLVPPPH